MISFLIIMLLCDTNTGLYHMSNTRKRSPSGVDNKAIALRLMPKEREEAVELSSAGKLTMSAFARKAYLKGLPLVRKEILITKTA